ncbi:MAG: hypothetical protein M5R36_10815 [Deltaproteobacteria bacterium]|nr:hypothetical protein [Deltaproteobacteria bacterium]
MRNVLILLLLSVLFLPALTACGGCGGDDDDDDDDDDDTTEDDDSADDDADDDDTGDDDVTDDDFTDDDTGDDDTADDDTSDDDTGDDDTGDDDTGDDDTGDDDTSCDDDTADDDLIFPPDDCGEPLEDPDDPGAFMAVEWEYGHDGDPDARRTNIREYYWTWSQTVPLHAKGYYPDGAGPFPLVLIVHGNHTPSEPSWPGYAYLTEQLATHGFISVSVDENFLNGGSGEMDARGIVLLRHLQLFREWNETPAHPMYQKVDMNRIGLAGHSRGGEAVGVAWLYNKTKHDPCDPLHNFNFKIRSLFAIAPVDGQLGGPFSIYVTLKNADYFIMHGSHDGDVSSYEGAAMYDRAFPIGEPGTEGNKGALFVQGANHSGWNTVWALNPAEYPVTYSNVPDMSAADQQTVGRVFMTAWYRWTLQGRSCYRFFVGGEGGFASLPGGYILHRQFQAPDRFFLDHYQEDSVKTTASVAGGTNTGTGLDAWNEQNFSPGETKAVFMNYDTGGANYRVDLPALAGAAIDDYDALSFRIGQVYETVDNYNAIGETRDLSVFVETSGGAEDPVVLSDYRDLPSSARVELAGFDNSKTIFNTFRIPLEDLNGGDPLVPSDVEAIVFDFDQSASAYFVVDDIQFTKW